MTVRNDSAHESLAEEAYRYECRSASEIETTFEIVLSVD